MGHVHPSVSDRIPAAVQGRKRFRGSPGPSEDFLLPILAMHEKRASKRSPLYIITDRVEGAVIYSSIKDRLKMTAFHSGEGFDTEEQLTVSDIRDCPHKNEPLGLHVVRAADRFAPI